MSFSSAVCNEKVIPNEKCIKQHQMVVCDFTVHILMWRNASSCLAFVPGSSGTQFCLPIPVSPQVKSDDCHGCSCYCCWCHCWFCRLCWDNWVNTKGPSSGCYHQSMNNQWRTETWWWNAQVDEAIKDNHAQFKAYKALKKGSKSTEAWEAKATYNVAKHVT